MSGSITGIAAGICVGAAVIAIFWDEEWNLRTFIKYQVAALGIVAAICLLR
ncbi:hypothetical protein ACNKJC_000728 [Enterobacter hormaechei]